MRFSHFGKNPRRKKSLDKAFDFNSTIQHLSESSSVNFFHLRTFASLTICSRLFLSFFDELSRLSHPDYLPTDQDILHCRVRTTGISEEAFTVDGMKLLVVDVGGQRSERKKW